MKRLIPVLIVAIAVAAFWFRDRWLPQPPGQMNHLGYVEGDTLLVGAPVAGRLVAVSAVKGAVVGQGEVVFNLDSTGAAAEVARAEAAIVAAEAAHANLQTGKRPAELEFIRAQIIEAEAGLDLARKELKRAAMLEHRHGGSCPA